MVVERQAKMNMTPAQYHADLDARQKRAMADRIRIAESFIVDLRDELTDMNADDETIRRVNIALNTLEETALNLEQPFRDMLERYKKEDAIHDQHLEDDKDSDLLEEYNTDFRKLGELEEETQKDHDLDVNINRYSGAN